jgi:hypothetical protein
MATPLLTSHVSYVASIDPKQPSLTKWTIWCPLCAGLLLSLIACFWMPWESVHPSDASLRQDLGYAPVWSHRFDAITGAHRDWQSLGVNLAIIWIICVAGTIMLSMSARRD